MPFFNNSNLNQRIIGLGHGFFQGSKSGILAGTPFMFAAAGLYKTAEKNRDERHIDHAKFLGLVALSIMPSFGLMQGVKSLFSPESVPPYLVNIFSDHRELMKHPRIALQFSVLYAALNTSAYLFGRKYHLEIDQEYSTNKNRR